MASENMTLKLLVDLRTNKVLYAEATKEFVDFLLHLFSLPLGTVNHLLGSKQMVGGLGNLKESVESFNQIYFQPGINKKNIIDTKTTFSGNMLLLSNEVSASDKPPTLTTVYACPNCYCAMNVPLDLDAEGNMKGGFVKDVVTYMVTDDLVVKPMSTISSITLIKSFALKDLSQLEEKTLQLGKDEALKLLRASLSTNEVLTTLFRQTTDA